MTGANRHAGQKGLCAKYSDKKLIFPLTRGERRSIIIQETKRSHALTPVQYRLTQVNIVENASGAFCEVDLRAEVFCPLICCMAAQNKLSHV